MRERIFIKKSGLISMEVNYNKYIRSVEISDGHTVVYISVKKGELTKMINLLRKLKGKMK